MDGELDPADFTALLEKPKQRQGELSPDQFTAFLDGTATEPTPLLNAVGGSALEGLAAVPELLLLANKRVAGAGMFGAPAPAPPLAGPLQALSGGLRGAAEAIDPMEGRGQGGLPEDLARGVGSILGAAPAMALGPGAAAVQFGAQEGVPLYYDVKEATGGDEEAALWALIGGGALGQLEKFGVEGLLGKAVKRWAGGSVGDALVKTLTKRALGIGAAGVGEASTELAQQGGEDLIFENLTGEDVDNIERLKRALPPALILGTGLGALVESVDAAKARRGTVGGPGAPDAAQGEPARGPDGSPHETKAPPAFTDVAKPAPAPARTVADISLETAPGAQQASAAPQMAQEAQVAPASPTAQPVQPEMVIESPGVTDRSAEAIRNQETTTRPEHRYRGMTEAEYAATVGSGGGVQSRRDFSFGSEGTSFAEDFPTASSYVNFGRDDPRKTGKPTYVVEVAAGPNLKRNRQGYYEAEKPVEGRDIRRVWKVEARGDDLVAVLQSPSAVEAKPLTRREELGRKKAHELTADEASEALALQEEYEATADVQALGEAGAKEWNRLQRQQNSTNQATADKAAARIAEIEATLTPEQQKLLYGVGEEGMGAETLRELSSELQNVAQAADEAELGRIVAKSLADVRQGDPESFQPGTKEALAAARLAEAGRTIAAKGFDSEKVTKAALARAQELYGADAPELLRRWLPKAEEAPAEAPKALPAPEAPKPPAKPTGIKNATVERELKDMGLPMPKKDAKRGFVELHAEAKATLEKTPDAGRELVDSLEASPRPPTDAEDALLTFESNRLKQERIAAEEAYLKNPTEANQERIDRARADYMRAANVFDRVGTESGRALNARKLMIAEDYSLAAMERSVQVAKGADPLTKEESAKIKELHEKIAAKQKELDEYTTQAELREAELEAKLALAEAKKFAAKEERGAKRRKSISQSKARIDELLNKLGGGQKAAAGIDPEKVALTFQLAKEYVNLGYQNFRLFSDEIVARVGEHVRPYLRKAWDDANEARDAEMLARYKARKEGDIARIKERTKAGVFETARRKTPVAKDPRAVELKVEYEGAKKEFERERERIRRKNRTKKQKALDAAREALALPRALKFSFDLVPIFRQAARYAVPDIFFNPKRLAEFTAKGLSASVKRNAQRIDVELRDSKSNPMYPLAEAGGLSLPEVEEEMSSWIANKIPGINASSRIYNTFMNLYRMSAFEGLLRGLPGPISLDDARTAARAVNMLSGRGHAKGKVASAVDGLGAALSSPRLLLSNLQTIAGAPLYYGSWRVRKRVAKQYARFLTGYAALYGMVELIDAVDDEDDVRVEWDPRSSDFGKIIVGEKRFDVLGGLSQVTTLIGRAATGEKMSVKGKVTPLRGEKAREDVLDIAQEFMRYKLSPAFSVGVEVLTGKQTERGPGGKPLPVTAESVAEGLLVPISVEDIYDDMRKFGVDDTLAMRMIGLFGAGVRDYNDKKK